MKEEVEPIHLLWTLMFLKGYHKESVNSAIAEVDEKTFRKWVWILIPEISYLEGDLVSNEYTYLYMVFNY